MPRLTKLEAAIRKMSRQAQAKRTTFTNVMLTSAKTRGTMQQAFAAHTRLVLREFPHLTREEAWSYSLQLLHREWEKQPLVIRKRWDAEIARINIHFQKNEKKILPQSMVKKPAWK